MKTRILSVVLTVVMLLAIVPVSAFADSNVINVTAANAQDWLDGKYGSIDGKTINFTESISTVLELARPTMYQGSNTKYYKYDISIPGPEATATPWNENISTIMNSHSHYYRTIKDVTFTANKGVTLAGFHFSAGHVASTGHDYVRGVDQTAGVTHYDHRSLDTIFFKGLTITGCIDLMLYSEESKVENIRISGCNFIGTTDTDLAAVRMLADSQYFVNSIITNNTINNYFQGIYISGIDKATISNNTITNTEHNAIALQSCDDKNPIKNTVLVNVNYIENTDDRAIRINYASDKADLRILNNVMLNAGDDEGEIIKATSLADKANIVLINNYLDGAKTLAEIKDAVKGYDKYNAIGNNIGVRSGSFKQDVSAYIAPGFDQNENGQVMIQRNITIENGTANVSKAIAGQTVTIDADDIIGGKQFIYWEIVAADGKPVEFVRGGKSTEIASFIMPNCDVTITAVYRAVLPMFMHSIIVVDSDYGTTSPTGIMLVMQGLSHKFTFTPDEGCEIVDVLINGESVGAVDSYRLTVNEFVNTVEAIYAPIVDAD